MKHFIFKLVVAIALLSTPATVMADDVSVIAERAFKLAQQKNYNAAFPLMLQAAEGGDCISQGTLGTMYYKGYGTAIDYTKALSWWDKAIKDGCGASIKSYRDDLLRTNSFTADGIKYLVNQNYTLTVIDIDTYFSGPIVTIPQNVRYKDRIHTVTSIGDYAFDNEVGLKSVTIPNSVTSIGKAAFHSCSGLTSVTIPNSVTSIGSSAFYYCIGLKNITIPNSVTSIGENAFESSGLTSVTIPSSVTKISGSMFYECIGLTSVIIPNSVTEIGKSAFYGCSNLKSVDLPNSVTTIGRYAFSRSGLTNLTIPNSVTKIEDFAFYDCWSLKSVIVPKSVTTIGNNAFPYGCKIKKK